MFKRFMCVVCFTLIFTMVPACAFASNRYIIVSAENNIMPRWTGNYTVSSNLNITSMMANIKSETRVVMGKADSVKFEICLMQYKNGTWNSIKKWSTKEKVVNQKALFSQSYKVDRNYKYKVVGTAKVYDGKTLIDTINIESSEKKAE